MYELKILTLLILHSWIYLKLFYNQVNSSKLFVQFDNVELLFELWITSSVQLLGREINTKTFGNSDKIQNLKKNDSK